MRPPLASDTVEYQHPTVRLTWRCADCPICGEVLEHRFHDRSCIASGVAGVELCAAATPLPAVVNAGTDALDPAFTSDGPYVGFLRGFLNNPDWFLFVWDTETQTLINPAGVDVGDISIEGQVGGGGDNLGLYELTVFRGPGAITSTGTVNFHLASDSAVGILVQRVVGHHKLFGRTVPTLKPVGHVPLGRFKQGRGHVHWDLRVSATG